MDHKQTIQGPLNKLYQSQSHKLIQPKQPQKTSSVYHKQKKTPEFPGQMLDSHININTPSPEKCSKPNTLPNTLTNTLINTLKTQSTAGDSSKSSSLNVKKSLFPVKSAIRLKQNSNPGSKINPRILIPVLTSRRQPLSSLQLGESIDPIKEMPDYYQSFESFSQSVDYEDSASSKDIEAIKNFINKRPPELDSFEANSEEKSENEPNFLSNRVSYECDSNQSLKLNMKKFEVVYSPIANDSSYNLEMIQDKFDGCTQTEKNEIAAILSTLDPQELQQGMQFLSKIYKLLENIIKP